MVVWPLLAFAFAFAFGGSVPFASFTGHWELLCGHRTPLGGPLVNVRWYIPLRSGPVRLAAVAIDAVEI